MDTDARFMTRALRLAERGMFSATPNPRVGCVLVSSGRIVAEGWHERAGAPHAEAIALAAAGDAARGATAYVTLEPCAHHGRTPPCAEALIAAGLARVVVAMTDPNPQVCGRGLEKLRAAGIETACGLLEDEARELNMGFIARMTRARPWLRLKAAASLDGKTALNNGASQWITGPEARHDGHCWRARACALLTGIGTVLADDPRLNVRDIPTPRAPLKIVVDSRFRTPPSARLFQDGQTWIVGAVEDAEKIAALRHAGAEILLLPGPEGKVDLPALLAELARREMNEIHVEAGAHLNGALLTEGLVDEILLYLAPRLIGHHGRGIFDLPEYTRLDEAQRLEIRDTQNIGQDIRLIARRGDQESGIRDQGTGDRDQRHPLRR